MNLTKITCTGADDSIDPEDLLVLAKKYPFAEFGILLSKSRYGDPRFPSKVWLQRLTASLNNQPGLNLSAHICGKWVRDILLGKWSILDEQPDLMHWMQRVQLNFHAGAQVVDTVEFSNGCNNTKLSNKQIILQRDGVNDMLYDLVNYTNVVPLFDLSHGAGILPAEWPSADDFPLGCGYAGGLSPDNVVEQLHKISRFAYEVPIWIDAETHLRPADDTKFDLEKVEAFLKAVEPFVRLDDLV